MIVWRYERTTITIKAHTTNAIGTIGRNAAIPTPACMTTTTRISSVAYAVEEIASDAKTGRAMSLRSLWWPSSADEMGLPTKTRFIDATANTALSNPRTGSDLPS